MRTLTQEQSDELHRLAQPLTDHPVAGKLACRVCDLLLPGVEVASSAAPGEREERGATGGTGIWCPCGDEINADDARCGNCYAGAHRVDCGCPGCLAMAGTVEVVTPAPAPTTPAPLVALPGHPPGCGAGGGGTCCGWCPAPAVENGGDDLDCTCVAPHPACPNRNGTGKVTP